MCQMPMCCELLALRGDVGYGRPRRNDFKTRHPQLVHNWRRYGERYKLHRPFKSVKHYHQFYNRLPESCFLGSIIYMAHQIINVAYKLLYLSNFFSFFDTDFVVYDCWILPNDTWNPKRWLHNKELQNG
jgi:hypothetical protein